MVKKGKIDIKFVFVSMPSATSTPNLVLVDELAQTMGFKAYTTVKTAFLDSGYTGLGGLRGPDAPGHKY